MLFLISFVQEDDDDDEHEEEHSLMESTMDQTDNKDDGYENDDQTHQVRPFHVDFTY